MEIRPADADRDAAACLGIYAPFVDGSAVSFEESVPSPEEFAGRIRRLAASHVFLVAAATDASEPRVPDGILGYAYAGPYRERAAYRWAAETSVYVHPAARGRGLGGRLYAALFERMRTMGLRTAIAGITLPNPASEALHRACGFTPVGVFEQIGWKAGAWRDVAFLSLDLVPDADPTLAPVEPRRP